MALPVWNSQEIIDNLTRTGDPWGTSVITYGFPTSSPLWAAGDEGTGFSTFTESQKDVARLVLSLWDDVAAVDFKETVSKPQITLQNTTTANAYAHAYFPGNYGGGGSVWMNPKYNSGTNDLVSPKAGDWGFMTFIHEVGHALGLDHPGEYSGSVTYGADAGYRQDTVMYTVMSYFVASNTGADWVGSDGHTHYAQTPMLHDILAIQSLYGVEHATRAGDTVYGFSSNANRAVYDFSQNKHPVLCIWDGGGNDTLDLSGFSVGSRISLAPGTFSDCDAMTRNLSIASGAVIENAEGGSGKDVIQGNGAANVLHGNAAADILSGGKGSDTIYGDGGNDRIVGGKSGDRLWGGSGADTFVFNNVDSARDVVQDFQDGIDVIEISSDAASRMADLAISGQGTSTVTVTVGDEVIVLKSGGTILLGSGDFLFA